MEGGHQPDVFLGVAHCQLQGEIVLEVEFDRSVDYWLRLVRLSVVDALLKQGMIEVSLVEFLLVGMLCKANCAEGSA